MDIGAPIIGMHQDEIKRMAEEHGAVILTDPDEIEAFKKRRDKNFMMKSKRTCFRNICASLMQLACIQVMKSLDSLSMIGILPSKRM